MKKVVIKISTIFTKKTLMFECPFNKVSGLQTYNFIK